MDKKAIMCLERLRNGHPVPSNVIKDGNFSDLDPKHLPEGDFLWYFSSENPRIDRSIFGYWEPAADNLRIDINPILGWRTTRRWFYHGQAPGGDGTYVMHEYKMGRLNHQDNDNYQDSCSLCRIFLENPMSGLGEPSGVEEEHGVDLDAILAWFLENSEGDRYNAQVPSTSSQEAFSTDDLMELDDFIAPLSLENSINEPPMLDEGCDFDLQALLEQMIDNSDREGCDVDLQALLEQMIDNSDRNSEASRQQSTTSKFSVRTAPKSDLVIIEPLVPGSLHIATKGVTIPKAKLEKLLVRLMKMGSRALTKANRGSTETVQRRISLTRIAKLWNKLRSL